MRWLVLYLCAVAAYAVIEDIVRRRTGRP